MFYDQYPAHYMVLKKGIRMDITQANQIIESNLAAGNFVLSEIDIASESIPQFLSVLPVGLQFTQANSIVSLEGTSALRVKHNSPGNWNIDGITAGMLQDTRIDLILMQDDTELKPQILVSGLLQLSGLQQSMRVTGTLGQSEGWVVDFSICTDQPGFTDITSLFGIEGTAEQLAQLNITLPTITGMRIGFNIHTASFTHIGLDGRICYGSSVLDVLCMFTPDLVITGKIPTGEHILLSELLATLSLNPAKFPQVEIADLAFSLHPAEQSYSFNITLNGDWGIGLGNTKVNLTNLGTEFNYFEQAVTAAVTGKLLVDGTALLLEARLDNTGSWNFNGGLDEGSTIKLRSIINAFLPGSLKLPDEVPDMSCKDIGLTFTPKTGELSFKSSSAEPWKIPIGVDGISVSDINLTIDRTMTDEGQSQVTGCIGGRINIGTVNFAATYNFPGDFVLSGSIPTFKLSPLVQDLCGGDTVRSIPLPAGLIDVELKDIAFSIAPQKYKMTLSAGSDLGKTEIQIKRAAGGTWGFTVGFAPPEQWKFSAIDPSLSVLDGLKFSDTAFILASGDDQSFELASIELPGTDVAIKSGLNFFANLSMGGLGVDQLLGIESVVIYAAIGSDPRKIVLEAEIEGEFAIAENVTFGHIEFQLQVAPPSFDVTLQGQLHTFLNGSELIFIGGLGIAVKPPIFQARMMATMQGLWQDPCGAKGLAIADVALDLGIAFPPIRPSIGIAGSLMVGDFKGAVAVKFDAANPRSSMVAIAFNRLYLNEIFNAFCPSEIKEVIPAEISQTVLAVGFEDVNIYIVPQATTIGALSFEQGISLQGTMSIWGLRAFASLKIDQTRGILVQAEVDNINVAGVFKLTGAGGKPKASLYLDLRTGETPTIDIAGTVEILGICSQTILRVSDKEFYFFTTGKIFDLFEAALEVRGGDFLNGDSIYIQAAMRNDLFAYLREKVTAEIDSAANEATRQLNAAQQQLTQYQYQINSLQNEINQAKARIAQLEGEIANKQRWYNNSKWWEKAYRWAELSAYAAPRYAEIGALYAKIGTLEAAKHIAFGALEVAKWGLQGVISAVGAVADAGKFIANYGLGGLIDIRRAEFTGYLSATAGGAVLLSVSLTFMNRPRDIDIAFNFTDPLSGAKSLAKVLLPALPA
jgi:hypothetical protein